MAKFSLVTASNSTIALDESNGVVVLQTYGLGMPPVEHIGVNYALLDGAYWQRMRVQPRVFTMAIQAVGKSWASSTDGLHGIRARLVNAINPHRHGQNPMKIVYTGNTGETRYLNARYEAGLEMGEVRGYTEQMTVRFLATDPYWYANTAVDGTAASHARLDLNEIACWQDGYWSDLGGGAWPSPSPVGVRVLIAKPGGGVYAAGRFSAMGGVSANNIAVLPSATTSTWAALGAGISGSAPEVYTGMVAPNGDVYVGGGFNRAGDTAAMRVAVRDVSAGAWAALGAGVPGLTRACAIDNTGLVYYSGNWSTAGSTAAVNIASWNGSKWAPVGSGLGVARGGNYAYAMAVDADNNLYAGGTFNTAGGAAAAKIAKWNGSAWSTLGSGMNGTVYALDYDNNQGYLYAAGDFTVAGGVTVNRVARWNGQQWEALGSGLNDQAFRMKCLSNGWLLVAGQFTAAGGRPAYYIALWNGYDWVSLPAKIGAGALYCCAEDAFTGAQYLGGTFSGAQTISSRKTLVNTGSAYAYPIITFTATASGQRVLYLRNDTTDQTLWFNYLLQEGEELTIDCRPGHKSVVSSYYGNRVGDNPLPGSQLATFCLVPGNNYISTLVDGSSTTITITYTPAYWGGD